ncbi:MAG: hypothetical protein HQK85_12440, partial [Nitrospinae bacterium]|nr:hypothetical protein [Nitrospinota bacterium]
GAASHYKVNLAGVTTLTCEVDDGDANGRASGSVRISASGSSSLAPTGVAALGGNTQVTITWNPVAGATSYNLYWSASPGVTTASSKIAGVNSPHMHTGLSNGTTYYYAVTAVGPSGESPLSAEVSAMPQAVVVIPNAPTGVTAVGGINQITVNWNLVPGATSYKIYWLTSPGVVPGLSAPNWMGTASRPFIHTTIDGLTTGVPHYYIVTAVNAAGEGLPSVEVSATAVVAGVTTVEGHVRYGNFVFVQGVTVQLYGAPSWSGGVASTLISDANGFYAFASVAYPASFDSTYIDLLYATLPNPPYTGITWGCTVAGTIATCDFELAKPSGVVITGNNANANLTITITPPIEAYSCDATISQGGPALASSGAPSLFTGAWVWSPTNPIAGLSPGLTYDLNYHCYDTFGNTVSYSVTPTSFIY